MYIRVYILIQSHTVSTVHMYIGFLSQSIHASHTHVYIGMREVVFSVVLQFQCPVMTEERVPVVSKVELMVGCSRESLVDGNQSTVTWIMEVEGTYICTEWRSLCR